jgi:hypothetical protein
MTSERPYHRPRTRPQAFAELRRCAGKQFDPDLVERHIAAVEASDGARSDHRDSSVPQKTALRIRLEIERLACALDEKDLSMLTAMAGRVAAVANKEGMPQIAKVANTLERSAGDDHRDLEGILKLTNELLALCRSPQTLDVAKLTAPKKSPAAPKRS